MRRFIVAIGVCWLGLATACIAGAAEQFDWDAWRALPVQHGGRQKPLDTLAREALRSIANRSRQIDPQTHKPLDPTAFYLTILFDWKGWENPDQSQLDHATDWRPCYFHLHEADKWDQTPLLRVGSLPLGRALGLTKVSHVTPQQLANCKIADRHTARELPFPAWAEKLLVAEDAEEELTQLERKGLELADRYWSYLNHRMGRTMEVLPIKGSQDRQWMSLAHLLLTQFDDTTDPSGKLRKAQQLWLQASQSFRQRDVPAFNEASRQFVAILRQLGTDTGHYPSAHRTALELAYNRGTPFRFGWVLMLLAALGMLLHGGSRWRLFSHAAWGAYMAGLVAMVVGFGLRIAISGRPPVTNMYESVIYVGAGVALLGGVFELIYRRKYILTAAATVCTIVLLLADHCPLVLDPSVRPLEPVLRSNFWLITHVMTITLSYAALALALGIANITLGYFLVKSNNRSVISSLSRFTYKAIQIGVLLLAAGIILGGVWADYSWGRFWGWDPKEVWALVALLGYLAVLHARYAGWVGHRGLAALSVSCFSLVVMAWYGVNFVLSAGLHSYGFGGGGQGYVFCAVALQLLYVGAALLRSANLDFEPPSEPAPLRWTAPKQAAEPSARLHNESEISTPTCT